MKDSLNTLFQQRFQGHEMPVDPGVWQGIQQQIVSPSASVEDGVGKLFKERFQGHETMVDPSAWVNISSQLGHAAAAGTTTSAGLFGWAAAGAVAVVVGTVAYFTLSEPKAPPVQVAESGSIETPVGPEVLAKAPDQVVPNTAQQAFGDNAELVDRTPLRRTATTSSSTLVLDQGSTNQNSADTDPVVTGPVGIQTGPAQLATQGLPEDSIGPQMVRSIIADITTEVQQQVLEQQDQTDNAQPAPTAPTPDETATPAELDQMPKLFMPNTFTPNGDLVNDTYTIGSEGFSTAMVRVYSMKSDRLVFSTNIGEPWTGAGCEDGMYMVAVEARTPDGRTATEGKVVWLNRNPIN